MQSTLQATVVLAGFSLLSTAAADDGARCLYISSYHQGYEWSDDVEASLRQGLAGHCKIKQYDMDTKRNSTIPDKVAAAKVAINLIESWNPDVVITSDDNAAKYVIQPHYRDSDIPFVFCGVNWTVEEYDFPFSNVTGIVEVAPIGQMLRQAIALTEGQTAVYLGGSTLSEKKNYRRITQEARELDIRVVHVEVDTFEQWKEAFQETQNYDFIILGSNSGIKYWSNAVAQHTASTTARLLTVTNHSWMMPITMLGYTKVNKEHGEWAAEAAKHILAGVDPSQIPLASNIRSDIWVNEPLLASADISISQRLLRKAKKY